MKANIENLKQSIDSILSYCNAPQNGLEEEIFLMISALVPIPNVDLFILNSNRQILLSWRNDKFYGKGWSIPGGCLRFGETMEHRVHETAKREIGQDVSIISEPLAVRDVIRAPVLLLKYPNMRGHNITIPYLCRLIDESAVVTVQNVPKKSGDLRWFSYVPENLLSVHAVYNDLFKKMGLMKRIDEHVAE